MLNALLNKKNVFVAQVEKEEPLRAINSTVRELLKLHGRHASSCTRNNVQHTILVPLSEDVQADIARNEDISEIETSAPRIRYECDEVLPPDSVAALASIIEDVEAEFSFVNEDHKREMNAALLMALECMCGEGPPVPGALLGGTRSNVIRLSFQGAKRIANMILSRLVGRHVLQNAGRVPVDGAMIAIEGSTYTFSPGSTMYKCPVQLSLVQELAANTSFCISRDQLTRASRPISKRKRV